MNTLRTSLILFFATLLLGSVAYPAVLLAVAQGLFPTKANGSLVEVNGKAVGSRQIAQAFTKDEYFWPRPSAAGYNASATGGSNWGANNPKLRDRVAQQLGPLVKYHDGTAVGPDIETWFAVQPNRDAMWSAKKAAEEATPTPVRIQALFFDAWLQDPANMAKAAQIVPVPADFVMASGAGMDPHITLRNAKWQLARVAAARNVPPAAIEAILDQNAFSPLAGLAGEPLVNVLEVNLALNVAARTSIK